MKITIDLDAIIARIKDRRAREAALRLRGVKVLRDWVKNRAKRIRPSLISSATIRRMRWMTMPAALVVAALSTACAYTNPVQPAPTPVDTSAPFTLTVGASSNTVTARVQNVNGVPLGNVAVRFATNVGSLSPSIVTTSADGKAATTLTAADTATVTATVGSLSAHSLVAAQGPVSGPPTPPGSAPTAAPAFLNVSPNATVGSPLAFAVSSSTPGPWSWSFGDGDNVQTSAFTTTHTYGRPGVYTASVSGSGSSTGTATITVTNAAAPPPPPTPALKTAVECTAATHGSPTGCHVTMTDPSGANITGSVTAVDWDWGDGLKDLGGTVVLSHTYTVAGTYQVQAYAAAPAGSVTGSTSVKVF